MDPKRLMEHIQTHPDYPKVGMILCHRGVVRGFARDGRQVSGLRVAVDEARLGELLKVQRRKPGIVDIQIEIAADRDLAVGDDVMLLVVAGDFRENVIRTLEETLNAVKTTVTRKIEFPV
jgi:molybdopterin synthase catalytic subunit